MLRFVIDRVLPRRVSSHPSKGRVLHLGEGSGFHVASLARQHPGYNFIPTDSDLECLTEGLRRFDRICPLPHNLQQPNRFTTEAFCGRERSAAEWPVRSFDAVVANRVGDPFEKPFYIAAMLQGAQLHLKEGGVMIGGYWPLERERQNSAAVSALLEARFDPSSGAAFPVELAGPAAAALTQTSNAEAQKYGLALELVVHALGGTPKDCTSLCVFRRQPTAPPPVLHIFPIRPGCGARGHVAIRTAPDGGTWATVTPSAL